MPAARAFSFAIRQRCPPDTTLLGQGRAEHVAGGDLALTAEWQADYDVWQKRDLSARRYVYVWADGVYLQARMEEAAECMLVLIGATPEGKKELVGFQTGVRENAQSWRELLIDIKQRGLEIAPDLTVGDGALGFWKAIEQVFPSTRHQRCWVHKTANLLNKVALSVQVNMKLDLREIYGAPTRAAAEAAVKRSKVPKSLPQLLGSCPLSGVGGSGDGRAPQVDRHSVPWRAAARSDENHKLAHPVAMTPVTVALVREVPALGADRLRRASHPVEPDTSRDKLRRCARWAACGHKGATLQHPGWVEPMSTFCLFPRTSPGGEVKS